MASVQRIGCNPLHCGHELARAGLFCSCTALETYEAIGKRYREILARSHVDVELRLTNGAVENVKLLNDPTSGIKIGIAQGGISDSDRSPDLLSLGRINYQIYWIFHRATETLDDLRQLKGKRIAVGPQGSGQRVTTEKILAISGVNSENTTLLNLSTQDAENALNDGQIDALFCPLLSMRQFSSPC